MSNNWQKIIDSPLSSIYISELYWLAKETVDECEKIFQDVPLPQPPPKTYIKVDHEIHSRIYSITLKSAKIKTMITSRKKTSKQNVEEYEVQCNRINWLKSLLEGIQIVELLNPSVRNTIEHYDEYIDQIALNCLKGVISTPAIFPQDMCIGRSDTIQGNVYYLRVYIAETKTFINAGKEINLEKLHDECLKIRDYLFNQLPKDITSNERGSSMVVITDLSFE